MGVTERASTDTGAEPAIQDGRRRRAEANRLRIVQAMIDLVREGDSTPSAEVVAERAGVSHRTVFRLFNDMDGLYREMQGVMLRRLDPLLHQPLAGEDWRARLSNLMAQRARIFEEILPVKTAADAKRARSSFLQGEHRRFTRMQREMLTFLLPEAVKGQAQLLDALDLALSFESWRRLRMEQELTAEAALAVMERTVCALLTATPDGKDTP
jgi:AcrR family transcriptional regulator